MSKNTRKANTEEMGQDKDNTHIVQQNAPNTVRYLQNQSEGKKARVVVMLQNSYSVPGTKKVQKYNSAFKELRY
jgi:hypothetical protein